SSDLIAISAFLRRPLYWPDTPCPTVGGSHATVSTPKEQPQVRLDKWLWAARFFKTRSLAKEAIEGGRVTYNGQRTKPGKTVDPGALIRLRLGWQEKTVVVDGVSGQRRGAPEAQLLYTETAESASKREDDAWKRKTLQAAHLPPA